MAEKAKLDPYRDARHIGWYSHPERLDEIKEQLDPLIYEICLEINRSGWLWTAESCAGHPDSTEFCTWASNVRPMLRLVCQAADVPLMMDCLLTAMFVPDSDEFPDDRPVSFECHPISLEKGWCEVLIYLAAQTAYERNRGLAAFSRLAGLSCSLRPREPGSAAE